MCGYRPSTIYLKRFLDQKQIIVSFIFSLGEPTTISYFAIVYLWCFSYLFLSFSDIFVGAYGPTTISYFAIVYFCMAVWTYGLKVSFLVDNIPLKKFLFEYLSFVFDP